MKILSALKRSLITGMYLLDTNVISEMRKKTKANPGVLRFFRQSIDQQYGLYLSVVTIGEIRRGVEIVRYRGDVNQANQLNKWLQSLVAEYRDHLLEITIDIAQLWGHLRSPHPENALDKQIAATALIYDLTVVTRNDKDFVKTGVTVFNPFLQ